MLLQYRERQLQLEELTRELKKVSEEADILKTRMNTTKPAQVLISWLFTVLANIGSGGVLCLDLGGGIPLGSWNGFTCS